MKKMHISAEWLRRITAEMEEEGIEEPTVIGPPMSDMDFVRVWVEIQISKLEREMQAEWESIKSNRAEATNETIFKNMGNTITLVLHSKIDVLQEMKKTLEDIAATKEI